MSVHNFIYYDVMTESGIRVPLLKVMTG
jgi:hypothetical protein